MKNKNGFTLIELLATIMVIGIVSLITVPVVNNTIQKSKKSSFLRSIESINKISGDYYITNSALIEEYGVVKFTCSGKACVLDTNYEDEQEEKLETKGSTGTGYIKIYSGGEVEILLSSGSYCAVKYPNQSRIEINDSGCDNILIKTFIVNFDAGEGITDITSKTVMNDENYGSLPTATRDGYVFAGWYTLPQDGMQVDEKTKVSLSENQTLYAHWTKTGKAVTLGGYKWHIIGEYQDEQNRTLVTLLMDAGQLGEYSNMAHCTNDADASTDCGVDSTGTSYEYSWDKSLIRTYLNSTFLNDLKNKMSDELVPTKICIDRYNENASYGGYSQEEIANIVGASCTNFVTDYVRLISQAEYWNLSPYYTGENFYYPNMLNITRLLNNSDYSSWLFCSSNKCGNEEGYWWGMGYGDFKASSSIRPSGVLAGNLSIREYGVRPVITIVK